MKLVTEIPLPRPEFRLAHGDRILILGSCFAPTLGERLAECGFDVMVNPFGTLYNPLSLQAAVERLRSGEPFGPEDVVKMGSGSPFFCSFSHHTLAARPTPEEFLSDANAALGRAVEFYRSCNRVIFILGTAFVYRHRERGEVVGNCLKRPAAEFERVRLGVEECAAAIRSMCAEDFAPKDYILTVSPIRHLADGAHGNNLSKGTLLLALEECLGSESSMPSGRPTLRDESLCNGTSAAAGPMPLGRACYFPSYELLLDEMRDYRFYAEDLCHPSATAIEYFWEKFASCFMDEATAESARIHRKQFLASRHRPLH